MHEIDYLLALNKYCIFLIINCLFFAFICFILVDVSFLVNLSFLLYCIHLTHTYQYANFDLCGSVLL